MRHMDFRLQDMWQIFKVGVSIGNRLKPEGATYDCLWQIFIEQLDGEEEGRDNG